MPQATLNFNYLDKRTINALYEDCLCFTALDDNCNIGFSIHDTFEAEANTKTFTISYSVDNGYTWNSITASGSGTIGNIATINAGKNLLVRGTNETLEGFRFTSGTGKTFNLSGNILSLLDGDIDNINELPNLCFSGVSNYGIFAKTGVIDASRLHLPDFTSFGCYVGMFRNSSIVKAPALPATELSERCYVYMFASCASLISPPELPALSIPPGAYGAMFQHCTALTEAPALPATTLSIECYMQMFYGCTSLATAPGLPAIYLATSCYKQMFYGCTSLATAPGLPAIYLANSCYNAMFRNCTSLVSPPELPAQLIYQLNASGNPHEYVSAGCYSSMFRGCTSLKYAPYLPSKIIPQDGYDNMFDGCTNLSYIHIAAEPIDTTSTYINRLNNWVRNVAPTGTFVKASANSVYLIDSSNGVPTGWTVYNDGDEIPERVNVTVTANDDSMGTVYGGGTYATGTYVQIQAIPNLGYILRYWLINDEVVTDASTYRFQVSHNTTAQAVFEIEDAELPKYTITLNSVPGNVTGWTLHGGGEYSQGSTVAISCENSGNTTQTFDGWYTRDENMNYTLISRSLEFIIRVTEDAEYYAMFKDVVPEYCYVYAGLDPRSTGMGSTTGSGDYVRGSNCTLEAYPLVGYQFICWTIDGERTSSTNPITLLVDKSYQYLAYIKPIMPKYKMIMENNAMWASEIIVNVDYTITEGMNMDDWDGNTHDPTLWLYQNIEEGSNVVVNAIKYNDYIDFDGWWTKDDHGTFRLLSNEEKYSFKMTDDIYLYCKWKVHEEEDATDYSKEYFTITALQNNTKIYAGTIYSSRADGPSYTIEASINNGEFVAHLIIRTQNDPASNRLICTLNNGDNVRLRAVMPWDWSYNGYHYIVKNLLIDSNKLVKISGNLLSLVAGAGYLNSSLLSSNYITFPFVFNYSIFDARNVWFPYLSDITQNAHWSDAASYYANYYNSKYNQNDGRFSHMFAYNSYMLAGPNSINENVDYYAYSYLFYECHNIFDPPICPATTLADGCYHGMFEYCDKLVNGVNLMGTTLAVGCYARMYDGCSNLQNPGSLNAKTLASWCCDMMYTMCTSLQTAPQLKAEQMVLGCYNNMFWGCDQLNFIEIDLKYKSPVGEWGMINMFHPSPNTYPDGRLYKDPTVDWMTREYLNSEGTNIPPNWTLEDISTT